MVSAGHAACYGWRGFVPFSRNVQNTLEPHLQGCDSTVYDGPKYDVPIAKTVHITMGVFLFSSSLPFLVIIM
jgi:hypothetical protein